MLSSEEEKTMGYLRLFCKLGNFKQQEQNKIRSSRGSILQLPFHSLRRLRMMQIIHHHLHHDNGCANLPPTSLVDVNWATVFAFFGLNNQYYSHHGHCDYHEHNDHHGRLSYSSFFKPPQHVWLDKAEA